MGLTVLHPTGEEGTQNDLKVDLVAVHGLNGHPIETWTHPKTNAFWLKDFLPLDVVGARVMTFGYNADVAFGNTTADINDHAKDLLSCLIDKREEDEEASRPLIFIAHSLGGIIVKKALFGAGIEDRYRKIFDNTLGIVFLGTPHRGSEIASYGHILASVATAVMHKPSSRLTGALQTNSPELLQLTTDFRHQLPKLQVVSFYEMKPTKPFSSLVVKKHSALLEADREEQIPVNADHRDICRFAARNDETYEKLFKRLGRMVKGKGVEADSGLRVTKSRNKHYELPHHVSPKFTGRKEISQKLKEGCLSTRDQKIQRRAVLYGMGGSGKTQICLKFAQDHRDHFWGVFWIDASSNETAERGFVEIAKICGREADFTAAKRLLSKLEDPWLLIIDNADNPKMDVSRYFPPGDRGTILLTTRNPDCRFHATSGSFEIPEMELEDGITLLLRTTEAEDIFDAASRTLAKPVVEAFGCLALAIVQAGAVIRQGLCNMEEYCGIYSRRRKELLSTLPVQSSNDYKYTVYTTWEVSVKMIEDMSDETSRNAIELLQLFCFFHYDGISEDILKVAWNEMRNQKWSDWTMSLQLGLLRHDTSQEWVNYLTRKAISLLSSFSLITSSRTGGSISMHPLVHAWAKYRMSEDEQKRCWLRAASTLSLSMPDRWDSVDYQHRRFLVPHINACLSLGTNELFAEGDGRDQRLLMASSFAMAYHEASRWNRVIDLQENMVKVGRNTWGEGSAWTLRKKSCLGAGYWQAGEVQKALEVLEEVLKAQRGIHSKEHNDVLCTTSTLALCYSHLSQVEESKSLNQEVLEMSTKLFGKEHRKTLIIMTNLARNYRALNQAEKAIELEGKVLKIEMRVLGEEHPATLVSMVHLASCYSILGQVQKAITLDEKTFEITMRVLGEDHPMTSMLMTNLAINYCKAGQVQKAIILGEKALETCMILLGEEHPDTLTTMLYLAAIYHELGRVKEAIQLCDKGLEISMRTLGEQHIITINFQKDLAIYHQYSTPSQEVSTPDSITENATVFHLVVRPRNRRHPRRLLTQLRQSTGSD